MVERQYLDHWERIARNEDYVSTLDDEGRFDEIIKIELPYESGSLRDVVVHRNVSGDIFCFHSPMETEITCSVCASGVRVWMTVETD
jgi:hypothetical protein